MFQTITGKRFCPIAAIAAPETYRLVRLADENPARLCGNPKGRFGRGLGNPHGWILGERKRGVPPEEPSGRVRGSVPNSLRRRFGLRRQFAHAISRLRRPSGIYAAPNTTTNARTAGECCAITAAKAKARAMTAAASNDRCKTSVRLQRSLGIVAAFMFCPIARAGPYRFGNTRLQSRMMLPFVRFV